MEYVEGRDAGAMVKAEGPLPVARAVGWTVQLLEALGHAHARKFVHRDVKPNNLLLSVKAGTEEVVKLADFGLARAYQASKLSGLTMAGTAGGTVPFMPPEQALDFRSARPPADQYSAAATLYYLLTGRYVHGTCRTVAELFPRLLKDTPERLDKVRVDLPAGLSVAVMRALERQPERRFADVFAFRQALLPYAAP
jgi:serine/threonine-protein kinase